MLHHGRFTFNGGRVVKRLGFVERVGCHIVSGTLLPLHLLVLRLLLLLLIRLERRSQRVRCTKAFFTETARKELVHVRGIKCVASELQIGRVLENLLRFRLHEGRRLLVQSIQGLPPLHTHLLHRTLTLINALFN